MTQDLNLCNNDTAHIKEGLELYLKRYKESDQGWNGTENAKL